VTTVTITTPSGDKGESIVLPDSVFGVQSNIALMHQVVVAQLAAARQGTHKAKNRGEVSGGGKKPYRQKGTGRARQGSTRSPQFVGGGTSHGPVPHLYLQRTPKKMKAAALRGALSDRARGGNIHVLSSLVEGEKPSTKTAIAAVAKVSTAKNVLVVIAREDEAGWKSLRNAANMHLIASDQLNTYDVLVSDDVVFTEKSLNDFLVFTKAQAAVIDTELEEAVDAAVEEVLVEEALEEAIEEAVVEAALEEVLEEESVTGVPAAADAVPAEVVAAEEDEEETK
jgi:large subunit ribosomal protein L4